MIIAIHLCAVRIVTACAYPINLRFQTAFYQTRYDLQLCSKRIIYARRRCRISHRIAAAVPRIDNCVGILIRIYLLASQKSDFRTSVIAWRIGVCVALQLRNRACEIAWNSLSSADRIAHQSTRKRRANLNRKWIGHRRIGIGSRIIRKSIFQITTQPTCINYRSGI